MTYATVIDGTPEAVSGGLIRDAEGTQHPPAALAKKSDAKLAELGLYRISETPIPEGKVATGSTLEWDGETVTRAWTLEDYIPPVPASASPLQIRKALRQMGLKAAIDTFIAGQSEEVQEAWEYAVQIDRDNALIAAAAAELNKTPADIDDLFRLAVTL